MSEQWYHRHPERMEDEIEVMNNRFPDAKLVEHDSGHRGWKVELEPLETVYTVEVAYPKEFPVEPPEAYPISPELEHGDTPHLWPPDSHQEVHPEKPTLDLFPHSEWAIDNTAVVFTGWVVKWLVGYENYKNSGDWVGEEADF